MLKVTSAEIPLKGKNKDFFEQKLIENIRDKVGDVRIEKRGSVFLVYTDEYEKVRDVFGIDVIRVCREADLDIDSIKSEVDNLSFPNDTETIRVETSRAKKDFPLNSQDINTIIGEMLNNTYDIDLDNPDQTVHIHILDDRALVSNKKYKGFGGLPVGVSGSLLSLFSGGLDSPVSTWSMMKRGCITDLLHVYPFRSAKDIEQTKFFSILTKLKEYTPEPITLYLFPYTIFYKKAFDIPPEYELVLFRRFLFRLGNKIALNNDYKGLITGDSVAQVASQTLDNLLTTDKVVDVPVYRPLSSFNKNQIVDLAREIGTYDASIQDYKDCCSLNAYKTPRTDTEPNEIEELEKEIDILDIVNETIQKGKVINIDS